MRTIFRSLVAVALVVPALVACARPAPGQGPVGSWRVTRYMDAGDRLTAPLPGTTISLVIDAEGTLSGEVCNGYRGSWRVEGSTFTVRDLVWTDRACLSPEGIMEQEGDYLTALPAATMWRIERDVLTLSNPRGVAVVAERAR